jgi:dipeptidase E
MKLLLTDSGITNASIHAALLDLLGKPIEDCNALITTTALYAFRGGTQQAYKTIAATESDWPFVGLPWKSVGVFELSALPSIPEKVWMPMLHETDVWLVDGGDTIFLAHWMRESGMADLLPTLDLVYVGISAGSMVMTPSIGEPFVGWQPESGATDEGLGVVDFSIFPHTDYPGFTDNTMAKAEEWAATIGRRAFAINSQTAIKVVDGEVEVVTEGIGREFNV